MALITVSGHLKDASGAAVANGLVTAALVSLSGNLPYVSGTTVVVPLFVTFTADANGVFSGTLYGNDSITPANTLYEITYGGLTRAVYSLTGAGPVNLDSLTPVTVIPVPTGPLPTNILTSNNIFTGINNFNGSSTTAAKLNNIISLDGQIYAFSTGGLIAAIAAVPTTGGTVDARGWQGTGTITSDFLSGVTKPLTVLFGDVTFTVSAGVTINIGNTQSIVGAGKHRTIFKFSNTTQNGFNVAATDSLFGEFQVDMQNTGTGHAMHVSGANRLVMLSLYLRRAGGHGLFFNPGSVGIHRVVGIGEIECEGNAGDGVRIQVTVNLVSMNIATFDNIECHSNTGIGYRSIGTVLANGTGNNGIVISSLRATLNGSDGVKWQDDQQTDVGMLESENNGGFGVTIDANSKFITVRQFDGTGNTSGNLNILGKNVYIAGSSISPTYFWGVSLRPEDASSIGAIVQGVASQTADLMQWRNSATVPLLAIDKDGKIAGTTGAGALSLRPGAAGQSVLIKGESGQTAAIMKVTSSADVSYFSVGNVGAVVLSRLNTVFHIDGTIYAKTEAGVQAAIAAAIADGGGTVDARGTGNITITTGITVGNAASVPITLLLPDKATWTVNVTDGTSYGIKVFNQSAVISEAASGVPGMLLEGSATLNAGAIIGTDPATGSYVRIANLGAMNRSGGVVSLGSFAVNEVFDNSTFANILATNYTASGTAIYVSGAGFGTAFINCTANNNHTGGVPVKIISNGTTLMNRGIAFYSLSAVHPGAGLASVDISGSGLPPSDVTNRNLNFYNLYMEGGTGAGCFGLKISNARNVNVFGVTAGVINGATYTGIHISETGANQVRAVLIEGYSYQQSAGVGLSNTITGTTRFSSSAYLGRYYYGGATGVQPAGSDAVEDAEQDWYNAAGGLIYQWPTSGNAIIRNWADAALSVNLDSGSTAAQTAALVFKDRGTTKWQFLKDNGNNFILFDLTNSKNRIVFAQNANSAASGALRLAAGELIAWRNNAAGADVWLSKPVSDGLQLNGFSALLFSTDNTVDIGASGATRPKDLYQAGLVKQYAAINTVGQGVPAEYATVDLTAQGAAITATTIYAVPAAGAGVYRISWVATVTQAASTTSTLGGTAGYQVLYTDADDSVVKTTPAAGAPSAGVNQAYSQTNQGNTTATQISGCIVVRAKASTNIQHQFDYTSAGATPMQYNLHVRVEAL